MRAVPPFLTGLSSQAPTALFDFSHNLRALYISALRNAHAEAASFLLQVGSPAPPAGPALAPRRVVSVKWLNSPGWQRLTLSAAPEDRIGFQSITGGITLMTWLPQPSLGPCACHREADKGALGRQRALPRSAPDAPSLQGSQLQKGHHPVQCMDMESDGS